MKRKATVPAAGGSKKKKGPAAVPPADSDGSAAQVSWSTIWSMYSETSSACAELGHLNAIPGSIYDIIARATEGESCSPVVAMAKAKALFEALPEDEQHIWSCKWKWSPQSTLASKRLATSLGDDPEAADANDPTGDYPKTWARGWRWYPVPKPKTKSHTHCFYPPKALLRKVISWRESAGKKERKSKRGRDAGCVFISSPELEAFLLTAE